MGTALIVANHFNEYHDGYLSTHGEVIQAAQGLSPEPILNKVLEKLNLDESDILLDCGSGFGFPANYLAKKSGCLAIGLNVSELQIKYSQKFNSDNCYFINLDFNRLSEFSLNPTAITFMESFCYSDNPKQLIKDCFDILKDNGRLLIKCFVKEDKNWCRDYAEAIKEFYKATFYSPYELIGWSFEAGFKVKSFEILEIKDAQPLTARFLKYVGNKEKKLMWPERNTFKPFILVLEK